MSPDPRTFRLTHRLGERAIRFASLRRVHAIKAPQIEAIPQADEAFLPQRTMARERTATSASMSWAHRGTKASACRRRLANVFDRLEHGRRGKNAVDPPVTENDRLGLVDRLEGAVRELALGENSERDRELNVEVTDDEVDRGLFRDAAPDSLIRRLPKRERERRANRL